MDAIPIWQLLGGRDAQQLDAYEGRFWEAFERMAGVPDWASSKGYVYTQRALEESILTEACDWLYVLALAASIGIDTPLARDFPEAFRRVRSAPFPNLSDVSALLEPLEHPEFDLLTTEQNIRTSEIVEIASRFLDGFLSDRLDDVNHFIRACEAYEDDQDDEAHDDDE